MPFVPTTNFADMRAELTAVLSAAVSLPEPPSGRVNVFTNTEGAKESLIEQLRSSDPNLSFPCILLEIGEAVPSADGELLMSAVGLCRRPFKAYYLEEWGQSSTVGTQESNDNFGNLMRAAMDSPSAVFNTFTVWEQGVVNSTLSDPLIHAIFSVSQTNVYGCSLKYSPGLLTQMY